MRTRQYLRRHWFTRRLGRQLRHGYDDETTLRALFSSRAPRASIRPSLVRRGGPGIPTPPPPETGWTDPVPTTAVPIGGLYNTAAQVGSRIFYISPSTGTDGTPGTGGAGVAWSPLGTNALPDFYLYNGTNILDSLGRTAPAEGSNAGIPYGTDPRNPSGPIKPFATYGFCGQRTAGGEVGTLVSLPTNGRMNAQGRNIKPDWYLWERGSTYDIDADLAAWEVLVPPSGSNRYNIAAAGCPTAAGTQVFGGYGPIADGRIIWTRPRNNFFYRNIVTGGTDSQLENVLVLDIRFDGHDRTTSNITGGPLGISFSGGLASTTGEVRFENCDFFGVGQNTVSTSTLWVTFYRCLIRDVWNTGGGTGGQGLFTSTFIGVNGVCRVRFEECLIGRCGFPADPAVTWPPTQFDIFTRNLYLSGHINHQDSYCKNCVILYGASGDQWRCGMHVEGNFIYSGGTLLGGYGDDTGVLESGSFINNVVQIFDGKVAIAGGGGVTSPTNGGTAHPNSGPSMSASYANTEASGNIVSRAARGRTLAAQWSSFRMQADGLNGDDHIARAVEGNNVHDNVFDCGGTTYGIYKRDGSGQPFCDIPLPGVGVNTFTVNVWIKAAGAMLLADDFTGIRANTGMANWCERHVGGVIDGTPFATNMLTGMAVGVSPIPQVFVLTCISVSPATWTVVGHNADASQTQVGSLPNMIDGVPYSSVYFTTTGMAAGATPFAVGDVGGFVLNVAPYTDGASIDGTNVEYANVTAATTGEGYLDVNRTLATYLASIGVTVVSDDGYLEAIALWGGMERGNWTEAYTAKPLVNHVRVGWNKTPLT